MCFEAGRGYVGSDSSRTEISILSKLRIVYRLLSKVRESVWLSLFYYVKLNIFQKLEFVTLQLFLSVYLRCFHEFYLKIIKFCLKLCVWLWIIVIFATYHF
jgi:hypothetical protein